MIKNVFMDEKSEPTVKAYTDIWIKIINQCENKKACIPPKKEST